MPHKPKWTTGRRSVFLSTLAATGNISAAARAAGVTRDTVYSKRISDPDFRDAWESAVEQSVDELEGELRRRAIKGTDKTIYYGGKPCGVNRTYSDSLGMFLLKGRRREIFAPERANDKTEPITVAKSAASAREMLIARLDEIDGTRER